MIFKINGQCHRQLIIKYSLLRKGTKCNLDLQGKGQGTPQSFIHDISQNFGLGRTKWILVCIHT